MDICTSENVCQNILIRDLPGCGMCVTEDDCMDEDPCTLGACEEGACVQNPSTEPECSPECDSHEQCDDSNACTLDICAYDGECRHESICHEGADLDGDGFAYPEDCDDRRVDVYPGAVELCDFRDNDCNGVVDGDACEFNCPADFSSCPGIPEEDEVFITLGPSDIYIGGRMPKSCMPHDPFVAPLTFAESYEMIFQVENLEPGDEIVQLVVHQVSGVSPLPSWMPDGASARLYASGYVLDEIHAEVELGIVFQNEDGDFVFSDMTIPENFELRSLVFKVPLGYDYQGYLQFGLNSVNDFVVAGKTTGSQRCSFPQHGWFCMVICPDEDGDGHDDHHCGGGDSDDSDPTTY
ncbi:putative metal-binding motif-containing protein [Patescibacteria group bacterium]|nr:putative metal-binding motif-containing protein [Patescibacteria group bacterium]MBU1922291.1 putative metal-binding motif-containing protein [Patescibacteria group bacterium]